MASWYEVGRDTVVAPEYATKTGVDKKDRVVEYSTKIPTGRTVSKTFVHWKCSPCGKRACTKQGDVPSKCSSTSCAGRS